MFHITEETQRFTPSLQANTGGQAGDATAVSAAVGGRSPVYRFFRARRARESLRPIIEGITRASMGGASVTIVVAAGGGFTQAPAAAIRLASQHCLLFAVDIVGSTDPGRDDEVQLVLRKALYEILIGAFAASGICWESCTAADRGDGVIVVIPAQIPTITIVHPLTAEIGYRLRRHNRMAGDVARIRLRLAAHIGEVHRDRYGLVGAAVNQLCRMLDAPPLREAFGVADTELALLISDYFYESVIRGRASAVDPSAFRQVAIHVKQFHTQAWLLADVA